MSGYDEIGAMNFANGFLLAGGKADALRERLIQEYDLDEATVNWHIEQAQQWVTQTQEQLRTTGGEKMKMDKFMYLPGMTQKEFVEHIEDNDFFRKYGNPVIVRAESGDDCVAMSAQLYDRIAEKCGLPETKELIDHESRT